MFTWQSPFFEKNSVRRSRKYGKIQENENTGMFVW